MYRQLQVKLPSACLDLFGMVEPLHLHHHAPVARLPQHLDLPDVGTVAPARGEEDGAVVDVEAVLSSLDGAEEELLGLALATRPSVALPAPLPQLAAFLRGELVVGGPPCSRRGPLQHGKLPSSHLSLNTTIIPPPTLDEDEMFALFTSD